MGTVEEEADEIELWLENIIDAGWMKKARVRNLLGRVKEQTAIIAASRITAKPGKGHRP